MNNIFTSNAEVSKKQIFITSNSLSIDRIMDNAIYRGNVIITFKEYKIYTNKLIFKIDYIEGKKTISKIIFPEKSTILGNDQNFIMQFNDAIYDAANGIMKAKNYDNLIKYDDTYARTKDLEIFMGKISKKPINFL